MSLINSHKDLTSDVHAESDGGPVSFFDFAIIDPPSLSPCLISHPYRNLLSRCTSKAASAIPK